jgi:hypothetical protein
MNGEPECDPATRMLQRLEERKLVQPRLPEARMAMGLARRRLHDPPTLQMTRDEHSQCAGRSAAHFATHSNRRLFK